MDRKFIAMFLATELLKEKVTTVGTMRNDRRDLPTELRPVSLKNAQPGTVRFAFTEDTTLVNNVSKKGKIVTVLCTQHCDMKVTDDKPDIILFYNSTKAGVDVLDKCIRTYSYYCAYYVESRPPSDSTECAPCIMAVDLIKMSTYMPNLESGHKGKNTEEGKFDPVLWIGLRRSSMVRALVIPVSGAIIYSFKMTVVLDIRQKQRAVIEFLCCENETVGNIDTRLKRMYGDAAVDRSTVSWWASRLSGERGHANSRDTPCSGTPCTARSPDNA
ncbi:hypothetical protein ANN_15305 [Periplaneta americana]|uniref:PiggyBac transposable element-derived protein domain-containing protein n=1 Tax=Periplaneta americana TaxID=6978 RepID=A0ABQ8SG14_PERAM|nr:hypothetical protein ANN_15305 [Periplaneta americana]